MPMSSLARLLSAGAEVEVILEEKLKLKREEVWSWREELLANLAEEKKEDLFLIEEFSLNWWIWDLEIER